MKGDLTIRAYSDADWAGDGSSSKSTSGSLIILGNGPIIFTSRRQSVVAQSTAEAEYIAANDTVNELQWLVQFLYEISVKHPTPQLLVDNQAAVRQIKSCDTSRKS